MAEESLSLPKLAWNASTDSFGHERSRKRVKNTPPPPSSDPPLFSSDDDPSVDNYTGGRRKRQFRGPWYDHQPISHGNKKQRSFKRQYDSGVFLGSDGTDMSDGVEEPESVYVNLALRQWNSSQNTVKHQPTPEELVRDHIELCLETGNEIIELSNRSLTTLSNDTIRPLSAFTRLPPVVEGVFERLEPKLKIFLASNSLTTLPEELFNLDRLTVLSLRGNMIHEVPPAIGRLRNLKELNLSQNGLEYLPYEILDLFSINSRLQSFQIHPNQFYEPQLPQNEEMEEAQEPQYKIGVGNRGRPRRGAISSIAPDLSGRLWHPLWRARYKARTETRYLDMNSAHLQGPKLSKQSLFGPRQFPDGVPLADLYDVPKPPHMRGGLVSRVPSLLEVALNSCSRNPDLPRLHTMLPDPHPSYFPTLLANVISKKESGNTKCTICKRNFIIARTEWIEWWEISKAEENLVSAASPLRQMENERDLVERMVPLIRRGCSWRCVPAKVEPNDLEGETGIAMVVDK